MLRRFLILAGLAMTAACDDGRAACFAPNTELPTPETVARDQRLGGTARDLASALFDGDLPRARGLLDRDPAVASTRIGSDADMLVVALATCSREAVELLIAKGAPVDGARPGAPLIFALRANDPWFAERLLAAGAKPNPAGDPLGPMRTAIGLNSLGGVRLLLDNRADPNAYERTGNRALHTAMNMETFRVAELLLERGADPWAIDSNGANFASALAQPMMTEDADEAAARRRLGERLARLGWPQPAPTPQAVRAMALAGEWPPANARGARPVPPEVVAIIRANTTKH